jgi:hypothetical protein
MSNESNNSVSYLESIPLARPSVEFESLSDEELPELPEYKSGVEQAVTVGSQISEFAKSVPQEIRPYIDNAFLLAQLAANFEIQEHGGSTSAWYDKYIEVLENAGWVVESRGDSVREVTGASAEVHQKIIPVLTAALGPAAAASSIVITTLNSLAEMNEDQPWITLFDRESQRASANQFQVSYVDVDEHKVPRLTLASFELDARRAVTQILFFKFLNTEATLSHFESKMSINKTAFENGKEIIAARLADRTAGFLTEVKI